MHSVCSENNKAISSCCPECQANITQEHNFCPYCGYSLKYQNHIQNEEPQHRNRLQNLLIRLKTRFSSDFSYSMKSLMRKAIILFIIYLGISLFFGGDPFRKVNEQLYNALTYAADKSRDDISQPLSGTFITCRENFCSCIDTLAGISDELGIIHQYIEAEKAKREKTGEELAERIIKMKKLHESGIPYDEHEQMNTQRND